MPLELKVNATVDPDQLLRLFRQTDFADHRNVAGVVEMLASPCSTHVSAWKGHRLIGFARGLSDGIFVGVVVDVVVDAAERHRGVGGSLVRAIRNELSNVDDVQLSCDDDLVPFYRRLGWTRDSSALMVPID